MRRPLQQLEIEVYSDDHVEGREGEQGMRPGEAVVPTFILKNAIDDLDWINADVRASASFRFFFWLGLLWFCFDIGF